MAKVKVRLSSCAVMTCGAKKYLEKIFPAKPSAGVSYLLSYPFSLPLALNSRESQPSKIILPLL